MRTQTHYGQVRGIHLAPKPKAQHYGDNREIIPPRPELDRNLERVLDQNRAQLHTHPVPLRSSGHGSSVVSHTLKITGVSAVGAGFVRFAAAARASTPNVIFCAPTSSRSRAAQLT